MGQVPHELDVPVPVDLVVEEGDPASHLAVVAERAKASLLALRAPREVSAEVESARALRSALRESRVPVMVIPDRAAELGRFAA